MSTTTEYTYETILNALRELVAENPDRRNPRSEGVGACVYTNPDGTPSCIVGNLAARFGLPLPDPSDDRAQSAPPSTLFPTMLSYETQNLLETVQNHADNESTWAEALDLAL